MISELDRPGYGVLMAVPKSDLMRIEQLNTEDTEEKTDKNIPCDPAVYLCG